MSFLQPSGTRRRRNQRGATLVEFALASLVGFLALFSVLEIGRLLFTHNALAEAARRGARFAVLSRNNADGIQKVKNVTVYGAENVSGLKPDVYGLSTSHVNVTYSNFGVKQGTVSVEITGYQFALSIPSLSRTITMPNYKTTMAGECAGYLP